MKGFRYNPETKTKVLDAISSGMRVTEAAKMFSVAPGTIYQWKANKQSEGNKTSSKSSPPAGGGGNFISNVAEENLRLKLLVAEQALTINRLNNA